VSGEALEARVRQYVQTYDPDGTKNIQVSGFVNVEKAYQAAVDKANPDDRIVVFGSFLTVAEALSAIGRV
jgi:dihydrofolate synthase/folylpolyglutamate synthase